MHHRLRAWRPLQSRRNVVISGSAVFSLLVLAMLCWLFFSPMHTAVPSASGLTLRIDAGFNDLYRVDYWTPVRVTIHNSGPSFQGTLSVRAYADAAYSSSVGSTSPWSFSQPVALSHNGDAHITLYAPLYQGEHTRGFIATLHDEQDMTVATGMTSGLKEVKPGSLFIGLLSTTALDHFDQLLETSIPNQIDSLNVAPLSAEMMPTNESVLENFDVLVLENFNTAMLRPEQFAALRSWINRGGSLLEIGGADWQDTLSSLPSDLLPISFSGLRNLPSHTSLLPVRGPTPSNYASYYSTVSDSLAVPLSISAASPVQRNAFTSIEVALAAAEGPLIVKAHQGGGTICYVAYDPAAAPLTTWDGTPGLWQMLLVQGLGDRLLISSIASAFDSGPGQFLTRGGLLYQLTPATPPSPWLIGIVLALYILALGPVSILLLRRLKRPLRWHWHIILICILLFSLTSYGLAYYQKRASLTNTSISIIRLNQGSSTAHVTTYMGLFTPGPGDFSMHIPGQSLTEPVARQFLQQSPSLVPREDPSATIVQSSNATDLTLRNKGLWTLNTLVSERDQQLSGGLLFSLALRANRLVGTVTNVLSTALSDVYVLFPHSFVPIGHLNAQETRQVNLSLHSAPPGAGKTLADQIAEYQHLPAGYFPYTKQQSPQTVTQMHLAFLSALSGTGFSYSPCEGSCLTRAIMNRGTIYTTGGLLPNPNLKTAYDPLLISGAQATVIGWADQHLAGLDDETITGAHITGQHMNFMQIPLNLDISQQPNLPLDFITGEVTGIQGYDAQAVLPNMYSLTTGNMTFSLALPSSLPSTVKSLTITVPDLLAHPSGPGTGSPVTTTSMNVSIYNWQTNGWERQQLTHDTFTVKSPAAYAGSENLVLVLVSNDNFNQIYFGKPSLSMN